MGSFQHDCSQSSDYLGWFFSPGSHSQQTLQSHWLSEDELLLCTADQETLPDRQRFAQPARCPFRAAQGWVCSHPHQPLASRRKATETAVEEGVRDFRFLYWLFLHGQMKEWGNQNIKRETDVSSTTLILTEMWVECMCGDFWNSLSYLCVFRCCCVWKLWPLLFPIQVFVFSLQFSLDNLCYNILGW